MKPKPLLKPLFLALALAAPLAFTGCQSAREFPTPAAHWKTAQGQLQYVTPKRPVIGDVILSGDGGANFQLDYTAGPGVPLMRLRLAGNTARMEGVFVAGSWQGDPRKVHGKLASWAALRDVFAIVETKRSAPQASLQSAPGARPAWTAQLTQNLDGKQRIAVSFPKTNERFTFVLTR